MLHLFRVILLLVFIAGIIIGCNNGQIQFPEGGHDFPIYVAENETNDYFYPYKDSVSTRDSFADAEGYRFYKMFNEQNLSIRPSKEIIFRFTYSGWKGHPVIITLTSNEIVVKKGSSTVYVEEDTSRLSKKERKHYVILSRFFPLNDTVINRNKRRKHYLDSLAHVYPELLEPAYYRSLIDKVLIPTTPPFTYTINKILISADAFRYLVNQFNKFGFWKLPYYITKECDMTDGYGFSIEANTGKKYQCVHVMGCYNDTIRITKACQELVKYAKMDNQIQLIWDGKTEMVPASTKE